METVSWLNPDPEHARIPTLDGLPQLQDNGCWPEREPSSWAFLEGIPEEFGLRAAGGQYTQDNFCAQEHALGTQTLHRSKERNRVVDAEETTSMKSAVGQAPLYPPPLRFHGQGQVLGWFGHEI